MREIPAHIKKPELLAKRRNQILKAAMRLFEKNGYHATTMREICRRAGVNLGSFYDYFGSKEDILVYIYKEMMYGGRFEKAFPETNISGWSDLEPFIRSLLAYSWNRNKHPIQLLYRETISLDPNTLREVLRIEAEYIKWVAENLRRGLGFPAVSEELEIIANSIVYIDSFVPLRGWNMHHLDQEKILEVIVQMLMMKLTDLKRQWKRRASRAA